MTAPNMAEEKASGRAQSRGEGRRLRMASKLDRVIAGEKESEGKGDPQ